MTGGESARRARAARAIRADEQEWRWNAGHKAITAVWTEVVERAEAAYARTIAEHVDGVGRDGEVTVAILDAMRAAEPEAMAEVEDIVDAATGEGPRERAREVLARALRKSEAMRECYLAVTEQMAGEARAA